jgi:ATP-dependent RNA helicase DDX43
MSLKIDERFIGKLIGQRGSTIKGLQEKYNVRISITDGKENGMRIIEIKGNDENIQSAMHGIQQKYSHEGMNKQAKIDDEECIPEKNQEDEEYMYTPRVIDWDKANAQCEAARKERWAKCPKMLKDFYSEHPATAKMTDAECEQFRKENNNISVSRIFQKDSNEKMPNPITQFQYAFENYPDLLVEIEKHGFSKPSPIQSQMWPILLKGEDCIGIAQTGTGYH